MHTKECIEKIIDKGKNEDMKKLSHMLECTINHMKDCDKEMYRELKEDLYEMACGKVLSLEMAEDWVQNMKPKAIFTKYDTDNFIKEKGYNVNPIDFYVTMNMMYSDYGKIIGNNPEQLADMSIAFLKDEDASAEKLYLYRKCIVNSK